MQILIWIACIFLIASNLYASSFALSNYGTLKGALIIGIGLIQLIVIISLNYSAVVTEDDEDAGLTNSIVISTYILNSFWPLVRPSKANIPTKLEQVKEAFSNFNDLKSLAYSFAYYLHNK